MTTFNLFNQVLSRQTSHSLLLAAMPLRSACTNLPSVLTACSSFRRQ